VVTHLTTNPPVRCLNRAERTGSLVVTCPTTTKTDKLPVHGMVLLVIRFSEKEKNLIIAHKLQLRAEIYPIASSAKRSPNFSNKAWTPIELPAEDKASHHRHDRR
jgi:hypothetical protein